MIKAIRDLLEAIAPSGAQPAEPVTPVVTAQPEPAGNVPRGKRKGAFWLGVGLVTLLLFFAFHRSQPVAPVVSHSVMARRQQTTTLTPSEVTQSGQALQNDTNAVLAHSQAQAHNLAADQFNNDPANTGLPDPNREAKLRAENANLQTPGSAANADAEIAAAGFLFVFCNVWYKLLADVASAGYTLDHMLDELIPMVLLNLASFLVAIRIPAWVDGVFSGSASAGHGGLIPLISKL